jgi:hypothetical protein
MTINLSAEMLSTLRSACEGRLVLIQGLLRESNNTSATRMLRAEMEDTQAAIDMLSEEGEA